MVPFIQSCQCPLQVTAPYIWNYLTVSSGVRFHGHGLPRDVHEDIGPGHVAGLSRAMHGATGSGQAAACLFDIRCTDELSSGMASANLAFSECELLWLLLPCPHRCPACVNQPMAARLWVAGAPTCTGTSAPCCLWWRSLHPVPVPAFGAQLVSRKRAKSVSDYWSPWPWKCLHAGVHTCFSNLQPELHTAARAAHRSPSVTKTKSVRQEARQRRRAPPEQGLRPSTTPPIGA